jgi:hypothetical protein
MTSARRGPAHPNYKGGWTNSRGYHIVRHNGKDVGEHRVVMERLLGRPLFEDESVHHINGDRTDNRAENLELWSTSHPAGQRVSQKTAWAAAWLHRHNPGALR